MTDHQTGGFPASQQTAITQSYTSSHTLDFTGDKNDVTTNTWSAPAGEFHLNQVDSFRFRSSLIEVVEELKLRRKNEIENEERTQTLIKEKHERERKIDFEANRMKNLQEEKDKILIESKRKFEEKMRLLEEKSRQDSVQKESMGKEMEAMKDELRKLQLSKYSLEKLLRDQERKVQIQSDSTEQHLQQLSGVEHKLQAFSTYCTKLVDSQERLDRQVKEAIKLNQTLKYVNEHQKCLIGRDQDVIASLEVRLLEANKRVQDKPLVSSESQLKLDVAQLTQQLEGSRTEVETLEKEVEEQRSRCNETLAKLQDSYLLIERHLANAATHRDEAGILRRDKEELGGKCETLKVELDSIHKELDIQISIHQQAVKEWDIKGSDTAQEMEKLKVDLELSAKNCEQLEELNSNWAKRNLELSASLEEAKKKLDVPKFDTEVQTTVSLFEIKDMTCQTSVDMVTVPSQTDSAITHPVQTQTYSPALTTNHTQTVHTPHQVAGTQTRVAAVANASTMATTEIADRGVQTLPVRVYSDFTNDFKKNMMNNGNEISNQSSSQSKFRNDLHSDQPNLMTQSDGYKNMNVNNCREGDDQDSIEPNSPGDEIDGKVMTNHIERTMHEDMSRDRQGVTITDAREISTFDFSATIIEDITENKQSDSFQIDADLNENHSKEVSRNPLLPSRMSKSPNEFDNTLKNLDVSQASTSLKHRSQNPASEETAQTFSMESASKAALDLPLQEKTNSIDENIEEIISPEIACNSTVLSHSLSKTGAISEVIQDKIAEDSQRNSCLISSYRGFGQNTIEVEKASPRNSVMSLSLRKPRTQTKRQPKDDTDPVAEERTSLKRTERHCRDTGKFTLSSEKPGLLFEGKSLLNAYMSSRGSSGETTKLTATQYVTEKRRASSRGTVDGKQIGQRTVADTGMTRPNNVTETRERNMKQTRSRDRQMANREEVHSRKTSSNTKYPGLVESSWNETTEPTEKLSPYSRYSAMFRSRLLRNESLKTSENPTQKEKIRDEQLGKAEPGKNTNSARGILKGFNEKNVNVKSVHFHEGPPETQIFQECPGDQSLFSDGEEDASTEENGQFVSLDDFQPSTDTSQPKRRKLE